jgi:hypothetical protein
MSLGVGILLAIATAFLAAALGAYANGADDVSLALFVAASVAGIVTALAWSSDDVRRRLPFARPFHMRCYQLWADGKPLHDQLRGLPAADPIPDGLYAQIVDWDTRVWDMLLGEMRETANIEEVRLGGRLANLPRDTAAGLGHRVGNTRTMLARLVDEHRHS